MTAGRLGVQVPVRTAPDAGFAALPDSAATPRLMLTIGLTPEDRHWLECIDRPDRFLYRTIGDPHAGEDPEQLHPRAFVADAMAELRALPVQPAGVIAADDYPATLLAAAVGDAAGLPGPSFESILTCAHKGWSRIVQREVVPEAVPRFQLIDPQRQYRAGRAGARVSVLAEAGEVRAVVSRLPRSRLAELEHVQSRARAELPRLRARLHRDAGPCRSCRCRRRWTARRASGCWRRS